VIEQALEVVDAALERVERLQAAAAKARRAGQPLSLIAQADLADASATAKAMAGLAAAAAHGGGQCYAAQQLWPDAHARYSAALKLCPDKAESRLELATTLYAQGAPRQALVELDGGQVGFVSVEGRGTAVTFVLPAVP
jgi:tetratricopeptide (TPR) repeat protein